MKNHINLSTRVYCPLLAISMTISLAACGGGGGSGNAMQAEPSGSVEMENVPGNAGSSGAGNSMSTAAFPQGYTGALVSGDAPEGAVFVLPGRAFASPPNAWGLVSGERAFQGVFAVDELNNVMVGILEPRPGNAIEGAVTGVHVHTGYAGETGPVVATMVDRGDGSFEIPDSTVLDSAQKNLFSQGGLYVNVHTDLFPDGEVRAQLPGPDESQFAFSHAGVSWQDANPQTFSTHVGISFATLNKQTGELRGSVFVNDLDGATAVEMGAGWLSTADDPSTDTVLFSLEQDALDPSAWRLPEGTVLPNAHRDLFGKGKLFFNVISVDYPAGEIRSQF